MYVYITLTKHTDLILSATQRVRGVYVNMIDLIQVQRSGSGRSVTLFPSLAELRDYTKETNKYFPGHTLEPGEILRHLLRNIL